MKKELILAKRYFIKPYMYKLVDQDYIDDLSDEEKKWLKKFNLEYYNSEFGDNPIHDTKELKRKCYNFQNREYRDVINQYQIYELFQNCISETYTDVDLLIDIENMYNKGYSLNRIKKILFKEEE